MLKLRTFNQLLVRNFIEAKVAMKNIEPIFVIIDDFSAFGESRAQSIPTGSNLPGAAGISMSYDYGFVDFPETGSYEDIQADLSILHFRKVISFELRTSYGLSPGNSHGQREQKRVLFNNPYGFTEMGTFNEAGSMSHYGSAEWQFVPSAYNIYGMECKTTCPSQPMGFVVSQFARTDAARAENRTSF